MVTTSFNNKPPFKAGDKLKNKVLDAHDTTLPVASRILRVTLKNPKGGRVKIESENHRDNSYEVAFGKPWTEEEFVLEAHRRGHPAHLYQALSDSMLQAIDTNVKMRPVDIVEHRAKWLRKWMSRAVELKGREEELHAKMPAERKLILARKRILLLREILEAEGYPDISICDDLAKGFPLVGLCGESEPFHQTSSQQPCPSQIAGATKASCTLQKEVVTLWWTQSCGTRRWKKKRRVG